MQRRLRTGEHAPSALARPSTRRAHRIEYRVRAPINFACLAKESDEDGLWEQTTRRAQVRRDALSKKLHVDSSFVTTQSKLLEKGGFVRRKTSTEDARIVQMSLTDKTYKHLASLAAQQEALNEFIFSEFDDRELGELTDKLAALQNRLEKACLKLVLDI